jgi:formylglycine-generating enzyme required for sulfatase activity
LGRRFGKHPLAPRNRSHSRRRLYDGGTPSKKGDEQYNDDERPLEVAVKDFRIGKNPITAEQIFLFLNSEEAKKSDRETLFRQNDMEGYKTSTIEQNEDGRYVPRKNAAKSPALMTWKGAVLFCSWLSDKTGKKYRLPSEAEWELAAGGKEKRKWPWGNEALEPQRGPMPNSWNRTGKEVLIKGLISAALPRTDAYWETIAVGSYPANANPEGVEDFFTYSMNEWCAN